MELSNFFEELPLQYVSQEKKQKLMDAFLEELEDRVGEFLTEGISDEKLDEFGIFTEGDCLGSFNWLVKNQPECWILPEGQALFPDGMPDMDGIIADQRVCELATQMWLKLYRPDYPHAVKDITDELKQEWRDLLDEKLADFGITSTSSIPEASSKHMDIFNINWNELFDDLPMQHLTKSQRREVIKGFRHTMSARICRRFFDKSLTDKQWEKLVSFVDGKTLKYLQLEFIEKQTVEDDDKWAKLGDEQKQLFPEGFPYGSFLDVLIEPRVGKNLGLKESHPDLDAVVRSCCDRFVQEICENPEKWLEIWGVIQTTSGESMSTFSLNEMRSMLDTLLLRVLNIKFTPNALQAPVRPEQPIKPTAPISHVDIPHIKADSYYLNYGKKVTGQGNIVDEYYDLYPSGGARSTKWIGSYKSGHWEPWAPEGRDLSGYHIGSGDGGVMTEYTLVKKEDDRGIFGRSARTKAHNAWVERNYARYNREIDVENTKNRKAFQEAKKQYDCQYNLFLHAENQYPADLAEYERLLTEYKQKKAEIESNAQEAETCKAESLESLSMLIKTLEPFFERGNPQQRESYAKQYASIVAKVTNQYPDNGEILRLENCSRCVGKGSYFESSSSISFDRKPITCSVCGGSGKRIHSGKSATFEDVKDYFNEPCEVKEQIQEMAKKLVARNQGENIFATRSGGYLWHLDKDEYRTYTYIDDYIYNFLLTEGAEFKVMRCVREIEEYECETPRYQYDRREKGEKTSNIELALIDELMIEFDFGFSLYKADWQPGNWRCTYNTYYDCKSYLSYPIQGSFMKITRYFKKGYGLLGALESALQIENC
jgi:hypothetical protein